MSRHALFELRRSVSANLISGRRSNFLEAHTIEVDNASCTPPGSLRRVGGGLKRVLCRRSICAGPLRGTIFLRYGVTQLRPFVSKGGEASHVVRDIIVVGTSVVPMCSTGSTSVLGCEGKLVQFCRAKRCAGCSSCFLGERLRHVGRVSVWFGSELV